jgi:hypothetical protein
MKNNLRCFLPICSAALMLTSCLTQAALTDPAETYIKTRVERHDSAEFSTVKIMPLMSVIATNRSTELQFTGYKYDDNKNLVICLRDYHGSDNTKVYDSTEIIELNVEEAQAIVDNYKKIEEKLLLEKPVPGEYVYHDYTVNDRVFISYRGTLNPILKRVVSSITIDIWVNSVKYSVPATGLIEKIQGFISY